MGSISYDEWAGKYKPVKNHITDSAFDGTMFETYGDEADHVSSQPGNRVWTLVDAEGTTVIIPGRHLVDRVGYFITAEPWTDSEMVVDIED